MEEGGGVGGRSGEGEFAMYGWDPHNTPKKFLIIELIAFNDNLPKKPKLKKTERNFQCEFVEVTSRKGRLLKKASYDLQALLRGKRSDWLADFNNESRWK